RDADACDNQRREDLVRGQAGGLHRDHLAVLVQSDEGDQSAQKHRKGKEARDEQRNSKHDIMPQRSVAIAGNREDLAGLAKQIERFQYQDECEEDGEASRQEQLDHVKSEQPGRKKGKIDHASTGRSLRLGRIERARLATLAKKRSSAP